MFCPKCGRKLPDGAKFCSGCGKKLINESAENSEKEKEEVFVPSEVIPEIPADDPVKPKKMSNYKIIIGIILAALVVSAAAFGVKAYFSDKNKEDLSSTVSDEESESIESQSEDSAAQLSEEPSTETESITANVDEEDTEENAIICLTDNKYELITDLDEGETIEIDTDAPDARWRYMVSFSPDGKYLYYYTDADHDYNYTLCRIEYDKLKENPAEIDQYIETITDNCIVDYNPDFTFLNDGSVIYMDSDFKLYYYSGETSVCIAENVTNYYTDGVDKIIYHALEWQGEGANVTYHDYGWYGVSLDDVNQKIELIPSDGTWYRDLYNLNDFENIMYTREEEDGTNLYSVGFSKASELLAESVSDLGNSFCGHDNDGNPVLILANGTSYILSNEAEKDLSGTFYVTNDAVYLSKGRGGALSIASISDGIIDGFSVITDDAYVLDVSDSALYYMSNTYVNSESDYTYGDLYACNNGKSTLLAQDVQDSYIQIYSDGVTIAYAGNKNRFDGDLLMIDSDGKETVIGSNIENNFIRADESTLLYISDGDLYSYNGTESKKLKNGVDKIWSRNSMKVDLTFNWYGAGF